MKSARNDLELTALFVVYPGPTRYRISDGIEALPVTQIHEIEPGR